MLRLDLHVHTSHSPDAFCPIGEAVAAARAKGLDGIAITDHNTVAGLPEAEKFSKDGFLVIPGIEVSSADCHIVGLGVSKSIPQGLPAKETVERIRDQGGIAIAAHPFALGRRPGLVRKAEFDAIEVLNSRALFFSNPLAHRYAERNKISLVAGSDAHRSDEIGLAYTSVDCEPKVDHVLEQIKTGRASVSGRTLPLPSFLWRALQKLASR